MIARALLVWAGIAVLAIANGALREAWLEQRYGAEVTQKLSPAILLCAIVLVAWISVPWIGASAPGDGFWTGSIWLVMTLAFEFLAGHYLFRTPWSKLLEEYNVAQGKVWIAIPLTCLLAPWLVAIMRAE